MYIEESYIRIMYYMQERVLRENHISNMQYGFSKRNNLMACFEMMKQDKEY